MSDNNTNTVGIGITTILFVVVAYFVYEKSISAALGMLLLVIGSGFTAILSVIPILGIFISYYINSTYTYPIIMEFTGLTTTWLTSLLFGFHTVLGAIITIATTAWIFTRK